MLCDDLEGGVRVWDGAGGSRESGDTHTHTHRANSLHCTVETNTRL